MRGKRKLGTWEIRKFKARLKSIGANKSTELITGRLLLQWFIRHNQAEQDTLADRIGTPGNWILC